MFRKIAAITGVIAVAGGAMLLSPANQNDAEARQGSTIVEIAADNPNFTTLVAAVQEAGLVDALNGKRHFTVFAPTNDAFAALGLNAGNIDSLPDDVLADILLYHVVPGDRLSQSVVGAERIRTLNGDFLHPVVDGDLTIDASNSSAGVVAADISASNGVIHVVDAVLLP